MTAVAIFATFAILCCSSTDGASTVSTSILLPDGLFTTLLPTPKQIIFEGPTVQQITFEGQVTVTRSTTSYILNCNAGGASLSFDPGQDCSKGSYTFTEISASTMYFSEK